MSAPNPRAERLTRADLKAELDKLVTKDELETVRTELKTEIQQVQVSVEELRASTTVQFGELRAELANKADKADLEQGLLGVMNVIGRVETKLGGEIRQSNEQLRVELSNYMDESQEQLRVELSKYMDESQERLRVELSKYMDESQERLYVRLKTDLGQLVRSQDGEIDRRIQGIDDKYADLPARVTALETR